MQKIFFTLLALSILTSCQSTHQSRQQNLQKIWGEYFGEGFNETKAIEVLVATNRNSRSANFGCADENFGVDADDKLKFGACKINVPKNHITGDIVLGDNRQSSNDYFKVLSAKNLDEAALIKNLKNSGRPVLIFVHGFNVKYNEAVLRAAGLAYDLKYQGAIVLFSWPSGSKGGFFEEKMINKTYDQNLANAKKSVDALQNFLLKLHQNDIEVNLVVHSMGHQVVLPALAKLNQQKPNTIFINHLILNAPDFEVAEFKNLTKNLKQISQNTTLYCSYNDKAMSASKTLNSNERLGACTFSEDFDTINVSAVDDSTFGLGHGYYSSRAILTDVFQNLIGIPADRRLFIIKSEPNSTEKYLLRK
ncbi:MAG: alpha/beta hydrolase [Pseudomonadota bacterium]